MKFSVLLPTRNRLELLQYAIESVRRQNYEDWEIIVSDNCSDQDIAGYVHSLKDSRISYYRINKPIPVTDNWNNALEKCTGDYVIMLGDDDCLMRGYFRTLMELLEKYSYPDAVYTNAFLYAYPGVMPNHPDGYLQPYGYAEFFQYSSEPFLLDRSKAMELVQSSMNFKLRFGYNMQYFLVRRNFIKSIENKGPFFQSPYPDYYAANVILLKADHILVCPIPLVAIGISPKSFGYYYFNKKEKQGVEFLKNFPNPERIGHLRQVILPGTDMNTFWMMAMETIKANYGSEYRLKVGYRRYRFLQILHVFKTYFVDNGITYTEFGDLWQRMHVWEKMIYGSCLWISCKMARFLPLFLRRIFGRQSQAIIGQYPEYTPQKSQCHYANILEVFEQVDPLREANSDFHH